MEKQSTDNERLHIVQMYECASEGNSSQNSEEYQAWLEKELMARIRRLNGLSSLLAEIHNALTSPRLLKIKTKEFRERIQKFIYIDNNK